MEPTIRGNITAELVSNTTHVTAEGVHAGDGSSCTPTHSNQIVQYDDSVVQQELVLQRICWTCRLHRPSPSQWPATDRACALSDGEHALSDGEYALWLDGSTHQPCLHPQLPQHQQQLMPHLRCHLSVYPQKNETNKPKRVFTSTQRMGRIGRAHWVSCDTFILRTLCLAAKSTCPVHWAIATLSKMLFAMLQASHV